MLLLKKLKEVWKEEKEEWDWMGDYIRAQNVNKKGLQELLRYD